MNEVVQTRLEDLRLLCARCRVGRLHIFGSAVRDDFDAGTSDLDFLVELLPMSPVEHARSFFSLLESLEKLFGRRVDLLERTAIENPYLLRSIEESRQLLYDRDQEPVGPADTTNTVTSS
jgi:predicted nucleotidyltransferase